MATSAKDQGHGSGGKRLRQTYEEMVNLLPEGYAFHEYMRDATTSYPIPESQSKKKPRKCPSWCECDDEKRCENVANMMICPEKCSAVCERKNVKFSVLFDSLLTGFLIVFLFLSYTGSGTIL